MRWLVTGAGGMLGAEAVAYLTSMGQDVTAMTRGDLDVTSEGAVEKALAGHDTVLNCAAWTAVDLAEENESGAFSANARGPAVLARACRTQGSRLVHVSTDYVFDGSATQPVEEDAPLNPQSAYGRSKAAGEWAVRAELPARHLIVRTGWLYGARGACFPKTIDRVVRQRGTVAVVTDQVGQPTWTYDVSRFIYDLVEAEAPAGAYHATSSGEASWHDFAVETCRVAGFGEDVVTETTSEAFKRPAPRPSYSVLGHAAAAAAGVPAIPDWRERWASAADSVLGLSEVPGWPADRAGSPRSRT